MSARTGVMAAIEFTALLISCRPSGRHLDETPKSRQRFHGGGQLGYNRQLSNHVVVGLETDAQWSGIKASHQASNGPGAFTVTDIGNGLDWFGTTRARLGWASGSTLTYVTGGVAYGDVSAQGSRDFPRRVLRLRDLIGSRVDDRRRRGICAEPKSFAESGVSLYRLRRRLRHGLWLRLRASSAFHRLLFDRKLHRQCHPDRLELAIWRAIDDASRGEILSFQRRLPRRRDRRAPPVGAMLRAPGEPRPAPPLGLRGRKRAWRRGSATLRTLSSSRLA